MGTEFLSLLAAGGGGGGVVIAPGGNCIKPALTRTGGMTLARKK
jgi:hypothetical protein